MTTVTFLQWTIEVPTTTPAAVDASADAATLDASCCSACATYLYALRIGRVPVQVLDFLRAVGANAASPLEMWGAPDSGFLAGTYELRGRMLSGPTFADGAGDAVAVVEPGWECWIAEVSGGRGGIAEDEKPTLEFEFSWNTDDLIGLAVVAGRTSV